MRKSRLRVRRLQVTILHSRLPESGQSRMSVQGSIADAPASQLRLPPAGLTHACVRRKKSPDCLWIRRHERTNRRALRPQRETQSLDDVLSLADGRADWRRGIDQVGSVVWFASGRYAHTHALANLMNVSAAKVVVPCTKDTQSVAKKLSFGRHVTLPHTSINRILFIFDTGAIV
jgi:hypothetical protein